MGKKIHIFVLLAVLVWALYLAATVRSVTALDVQLECATESTGKTDVDSRYETFDPAGSEKNYVLDVFGDGDFSYRHSTDGGTFATDLLAGGTVGAEEKVGLNLLTGSAFGSAAGFSMRGETLEMHSISLISGRPLSAASESEANDDTLAYDLEASGDGRYQSEAYAEERLDVSEERMSDLLTNLHLDLCPFGESESGAAAAAFSTEQYEYSESGSGVFSHSFSIRLGPTATQTTE